MPWARRISKSIPAFGSREQTYEVNDYSLGFNSFLSNDKFPLKNGGTNLWRLAKNARITTLGEYGTRKGFSFHSDAAGETQDQTITSTTGASDKSFNQVTRLAQIFTAGTTGRMTKVDINIKNASSATGTIMVELWSNDSTAPDEMLSRSSIPASSLTSSYQYLTARFAHPATVTATVSYWIVVYVQATGSGSYSWSGTTSATTAVVSADSGSTWSSTSYALNFKQYYATTGRTIGLHRAYKNDGTKVTLLVQGTTLYSVNNSTGALTSIKTGLNASATHYRFVTVNDIVYYVNGFDGLRKWDFTTESQVNSTNYTHIAEHKGLLFLVTKDDPNKIVFSNFADYETFTSTDFIYAPSPKTGDPVTAIVPLNGSMFVYTLNNKFILSGSDNATFVFDEAPDQKGTYTQETVCADKNFMYYLSDDGVYRSNGSEPQLLSEDIYTDIVSLLNKDSSCIAVNRGRLYLWHRAAGEDHNHNCYVWSLNYGDQGGTVESFDTDAYVSRAVNSFKDDNGLLVSSEKCGQVYWQEDSANDYTNLGDDIDFELATHYMTFTSPAVLKQIRYWEPRFGTQTSNHSIRTEYATDLRSNWQLASDVGVQGEGPTYGSGETYGGGETYGSTAEVQSSLNVPGEYRRIALRYKHHATRQPCLFLGHTLVVQSRRLR